MKSESTKEFRSILNLYLKETSTFRLLSPEEEKELGRRIQAGNEEALRRLVESNLRFVVKVAKTYARKGVSLLDLIHEGNLGLLDAARRFDPRRNVRFISYAVWWIRQSIQVALLNLGGPVRIPYRVRNALSEIRATVAGQFAELNRKPSPEEIAENLDMSRVELNVLLKIGSSAISMNGPLKEEGMNFLNEHLAQSCIPSPEEELERRVDEVTLAVALKELGKREEQVLTLRFGLEGEVPHTLRQIGDKMGLSRERIRQIESRALERLRQNWRPLPLTAIPKIGKSSLRSSGSLCKTLCVRASVVGIPEPGYTKGLQGQESRVNT